MVIITGAAGFIGAYLVEQAVEDNFDVLATDLCEIGEEYYKNHGIPFIRLDLTRKKDFKKLPEEGVDAVVHLACLQPANVSKEQYDPVNYMKVNTLGTLNILEFCRKTGIRKIIYAISHIEVEGLWASGNPISEDAPRAMKYTGDYAMYLISQNAAVDCIEHYHQEYGMQSIIFRLPPVYGYGPHTEIFKNGKPVKTGFKIFIEKAINKEPIEVWGNCEKGRDIIYVKDVVSAIIIALKKKEAAGLYNITSGRLLSLKEEIEGISRVFSPNGKYRMISRPDKPNSIGSFLYNISKARKELGWYPIFSYQEMLVDYKKELERGKFKFLLDKRKQMIYRK